MDTKDMKCNSRGFSMIEVMISVVVLGFGLMALAALQTSLIRSAAETKAQTVALQLAKDKLEDLRAFETLPGYQAITSGNDTVNDDEGNLGGVNYARSWTVSRFGYQPTANKFTQIATLTGPTPATDASNVNFAANNEYKRVAITVSWTDANGDTQSVGLEDAIGAVSPADGSKVVLSNSSSFEPRYPRVLIKDPNDTPGIIPIAVGSGETAATNPKPEIESQGQSSKHIETRFDVLTYEAPKNDVARVQSRVETVVVGCKCNASRANADDTAYRPTYWNGFRYAVPEVAKYTPKAGPAVIANNEVPQSPYCTACCRDHHDPDNLESGKPKFDPRRTDAHVHYNHTKALAGVFEVAGSTDDYIESCRLIRVDGIFRVAADMYNDHFNLLETINDFSPAEYAPTPTAIQNYQNFVLGYLGRRVVDQGNPSKYNNILDLSEAELDKDPALKALVAEIDKPLSIPLDPNRVITKPAICDDKKTNDSSRCVEHKWLHSRGLFIDYLESQALAKIASAKEGCDTSNGRSLASCVLPYFPFTSINLTELSEWSPLSGVDLRVTNNDFSNSSGGDPVRGAVLLGSKPTNNATPKAYSSIFNSNSGVAVLRVAIDLNESQSGLRQDNQAFRIGAGGGGGGGSAGSFVVYFSPFNYGSNPNITLRSSNVSGGCSLAQYTPSPTKYKYGCDANQIGVSATLTIGRYNFDDTTNLADYSGNIECTKDKKDTVTFAVNLTKVRPVCRNFSVAITNSGFTSVVDGTKGAETTSFTGVINNGDELNLVVTEEASIPTSAYTCTYSKSSPAFKDVNLVWSQKPCD